jgi:DNA invertase Pin-like site-specific DNA recombinase
LERQAYVYVRQSTVAQVRHNLESQRRQYQLDEHARQLGWSKVVTIDDDLGRSGSGTVERKGFERLLTEVCCGNVGAIFVAEASRLARNGREWQGLLEFCAVVDTLLVDYDGIYSPKAANDRLLLGMKGILSELELTTLRQRCQEAIRQKIKRGEYYPNPPLGYVKTVEGQGQLEKDPDLQIQQALDLVFQKFRELGSARQVWIWFHEQKVEFPTRCVNLAQNIVRFSLPRNSAILRVLTNPVYAGAYAFGRSRSRVIIENGARRVIRESRPQQRDWEVLIKEHHEGYISWEEYERNREAITQNAFMHGELVSGAVKQGRALLAGLLRCGHCGRKVLVSYGGKRHEIVRYACRSRRSAPQEQSCLAFGGARAEAAVTAALLEAVTPLGIEAAMTAMEQAETQVDEARRQKELALERARYEAERYARQYDEVEPENRLVAATLETRWNKALEKVSAIEQELAHEPSEKTLLTEEEKQRLFDLAEDLPAVWNHPQAPYDLKKRLVRTLIKEIVVTLKDMVITLMIHWRGGQHTKLVVRKNTSGDYLRDASQKILPIIEQLARQMPDESIASILNRAGIRTSQSHTWNDARVKAFRGLHKIPPYREGEREARDELNAEEVAALLNISYQSVLRMLRKGVLKGRHACLGAPWIIAREALSEKAVKETARAIHEGRPCTHSPEQTFLNFSSN